MQRQSYHTSLKILYRLGSEASIPLALRRHPQQATFSEISALRKLLTDEEYLHWPIASVAAHARRAVEVLLSNQTVNKYARLLGICREPPRKERMAVSIRASRPDEIIHSDITLYRTQDGIQQYIYLVMDNFS